jgi:hypothetical protein
MVLAGNFFITKWALKASGIDVEVEKILAEQSKKLDK